MGTVPVGKKICLITPSHISSNPRLVKEAIALAAHHYRVHLVFAQYVSSLVQYDEQILAKHPDWTYDVLNFTTNNYLSTARRSLLSIAIKIIRLFNLYSRCSPFILNPNFHWQLKKAVAAKANLYIAHNLGALPVAVMAANKNQAKSGFDAEDFHRHEVNDDANSPDVLAKTALEEKFIPQVNYITAASPLIAEKYSALFNRPVTAILNVFPKTTIQPIKQPANKPLQLFWFSQTIGPNRGLEAVIEAIQISNLTIDLHLLGYITNAYKNHLLNLAVQSPHLKITYYAPVYPDSVLTMAAQYDIGLATEATVPLNRDICLTNKIFTYLQSGLAIIASATAAQTAFMQQNPQTGKLYHNTAQLAQVLTDYNLDRDLLFQTRANNFQLGQGRLNWENENKKFITIINGQL